MPLDPEVALLLDQLRALPRLETLEPVQAREVIAGLTPPLAARPPSIAVTDRAIATPGGELPLRIYRPATPSGIIVYFHGGGWTLGTLDSTDAALVDFAVASGCAIVSVDYRLAPEHPFPAAVEDAIAALGWADAMRGEFAEPHAPLLVAGDSAGGNLAAVIAIAARDAGGPAIAGQLLLYPVTDTGADTASYREHAEDKFLTRPLMQWFLGHYLPVPIDRSDPRVAVLRTENCAGLPPTLIQTAEFDPLRDEGEAYGARLRDAGSPVTIDRRAGLIHGYFTMTELVRSAAAAFDDAAAWVRSTVAAARDTQGARS